MTNERKKALRAAILAGGLAAVMVAGYGVAIYGGIDAVSFGVLIGFPLISGFAITRLRPEGMYEHWGARILWSQGVVILAVALSYFAGLESMICIAIGLAPVLMAAGIGALVGIFAVRRKEASRLNLVALPVVVAFLAAVPATPETLVETSDTITIDAPPSLVFSMLKTIEDIDPSEVPTTFTHLLGVPKPIAAHWVEHPEGARRHSFWGDDVHFVEVIRSVTQDREIAWDFEFPDGWSGARVFDPHIEVGGENFDVLSGSYRLEDAGGKTRLTLTTLTRESSGFGAYARLWHRVFIGDFHKAILEVVRARAEAEAHDT